MIRILLATAASLAFGALGAVSAFSLPLISEVLYDAEGADDGFGFVELYGEPGTDVEGYTIEGVNGSNGDVTVTLALTGAIPEDGVLVVADEDGGVTSVADADLVANFDFQNGPDSVVLRDALGAVVDALGYGEFGPDEFFAGEGAPAPDGPAGTSVARVFADVDTDSNAADFATQGVPTPGAVSTVPEPATAWMLGMGGALLALHGRTRRRPR